MKRWYIGIGDFWIPTPFFSMEKDEIDDSVVEKVTLNYRCEGIHPSTLFLNEIKNGSDPNVV